ncbi:MAG: autotransporter outer membrane beta-barrel domain-containing protein [Pseudomonadota bacterium]
MSGRGGGVRVLTGAAAGALLAGAAAAPAQAQLLEEIAREIAQQQIDDNADAALAILGISAVPSETASTLSFEGGSSRSDYDLSAAQLGGGFTLSERVPVYLEGFIGWNRYDPVLIINQEQSSDRLPLKYTNVAATGGIGWDFEILDGLVLRPMGHVSIGRVQTDASVAATILAELLGLDVNFLKDGGYWAGGLGGSLSLAYNKRWENDYEVDLTVRHTHIRLESISGDFDAKADAITTGFWSRLRIPTGWRMFDRPVRIVTEASGSVLPGDQGRALATRWLVQGGLGGEIDLEETWAPFVTTTRLVARATYGRNLTGFSIGLAASF